MRAEKAITALLTQASALTTLLGQGATSVYGGGQLPQNTPLPAVVVEHISSVELTTIDANSAFGLMQARIQVTAIAKNYPSQKAVLEQVRVACNYQRGIVNGVRLVSVIRTLVGPDQRDDDMQIYTQSIDFQVTFQEP